MLYAVLDHLPMGGLLAVFVIVLTYLSYVTATDSNTSVLAQLSAVTDGSDPAAPQPRRLGIKLIYAVAVGVAAWSMITSCPALMGADVVQFERSPHPVHCQRFQPLSDLDGDKGAESVTCRLTATSPASETPARTECRRGG